MSAVLYHGEPNGPSLSVLAALEESGLDIETRPIDLLKGERHMLPGVTETVTRDFAVEGEGPVLVVDGEAMSEAVFLAQYFDEAAGGCGLQPKDPYAHWQMLMWCRQVTERLSPAVAWLGNLAYSHEELAALENSEFAGITSAIFSKDLRLRWRALRSGEADDGKTKDSRAKIAQFAERAENQLGDGREWLMGEFSIADLETYAWLVGAQLLEPAAFEGKPQLAQWLARVAARPSVQKALACAQSNDPRRSFAPGPEINRWG
ncbi:MAG: glutathione S-transferase-like protein, partial [Proteobacteria bacterium]|nr:glutathione S-transferase-like protein [Pseudomonadota bacterium]